MQLGTRWSVGSPPPERLSEAMKSAIGSIEAARLAEPDAAAGSWRWTLTWLEGHPRAELDDGTVVREDYDGAILTRGPEEDDADLDDADFDD